MSGHIGPKLKLVGGEMTFVRGAAMWVRDPSGACLGCKRTRLEHPDRAICPLYSKPQTQLSEICALLSSLNPQKVRLRPNHRAGIDAGHPFGVPSQKY